MTNIGRLEKLGDSFVVMMGMGLSSKKCVRSACRRPLLFVNVRPSHSFATPTAASRRCHSSDGRARSEQIDARTTAAWKGCIWGVMILVDGET
ncbi:hypothetical protein, partial [Corynebacterium sp. HMSC29G08]|uniref:hypothetical protein n=1 Tax=Corynebacterium sp. HMSC29G08 TaxID=1581069 RepID=UPI001AEF691A